MRCKECGGRLVRSPEGFLVCSKCGAVAEGSNLVLDSYTNFTFQDDWRLRREPKIRRRAWSWRAVVSTEASESSTAALVKYHLTELLRAPETSHLVGVVKRCDTSSLRSLFRDFLRATNMDYASARRLFEEACRLAGVGRVPDLSPTSVMSPGLADVRRAARERRLEREYNTTRELWGEKVEMLARRLAKCTLFQPAKPLVLGAALAVHLGAASKREVLKVGVGKKALETALTRIRRLSGLSAPDLAAALGLEAAALLKGVPTEKLRRLVAPSMARHYSPAHRLPAGAGRRRILEEAARIVGEHGEVGPKELAEMLGISYGYAKVVLYRLRKRGLVRAASGYSLIQRPGKTYRNPPGRPATYVKARRERPGDESSGSVPRYTAEELARYYRTYPGYVKACRRFFDAERHGELVRPLSYREWQQVRWIEERLPLAKRLLKTIALPPS